ncbi:hypothetical protein OM427_19720 [Halomonas sp. 18H]|nr:hypothetical protein [Halomonas sp. 18H]MCW4151749.1 hypothetical protein [Halomonas sp. 18H]
MVGRCGWKAGEHGIEQQSLHIQIAQIHHQLAGIGRELGMVRAVTARAAFSSHRVGWAVPPWRRWQRPSTDPRPADPLG